jgi:hypothetical protein
MFKRGDEVKHLKKGTTYVIEATPNECFIEKGWVGAYAYINPDGDLIIRPQEEMEDGRFVRYFPE